MTFMPHHTNNMPPYWIQADLSSVEKIQQFEAIPLKQRDLPTSTYELLKRSSAFRPDQIAIHYFDDPDSCGTEQVSVTFSELMRKVHQTANMLHDLGVTKDQVVPMLLANVPESQYALWGAQAAGIANPLNWMLEAEALEYLIRSTNARVLIVYGGDEYVNIWDKVNHLLINCPQLSYVIRLGGYKNNTLENHTTILDYSEVIEKYCDNKLLSNRIFLDDDTAAIFATGGTTASPKLARHTHKNEVVSAWLSAIIAGLETGQSRLSATPLFHVVGAITGCLATLGRGARLVLPTSAGWRHPRLLPNFWKVIETFDVNMTTVVPAIMNQLVHVPLKNHNINCLNTVFSGSAPLSTNVVEKFTQLTGLPVREGYGMTESTSVITMNPKDGIIKTGSVGLLFPYHQARIVTSTSNSNNHEYVDGKTLSCKASTRGLLILTGPCVFPGYIDSTFEREIWIDRNWLNTGDWAEIDTDGYVWIVGREKDLIVRGGHNIDPRAIEEIFYKHPDVLEVAVIARPDVYSGEVPVAYISLKKNTTTTADQLLQYASDHAGERASIPKTCYLLPTLPKSSVGKILKNELRMNAAIKAFEHILEQAGLDEYCVVSAQIKDRHIIVCHVRVRKTSIYDNVKQALINFTLPYQIELVPDE